MSNGRIRPLFLASACLGGVSCRYDGSAQPAGRLERLVRSGLALAVCPEEEGGLSTPRQPCELLDGKVICPDGLDVTAAFQAGAAVVLDLARQNGFKLAVLKERSPSCGSSLIYDGHFSGRLIPGQGVLAAALRRQGLVVINEQKYVEIEEELISSLPLPFTEHISTR